MSINLNQISEAKLYIHYEKFGFTSTICGYLLGYSNNENSYTVSDILPVCHNNIAGPVLDLAFKFHNANSNQSNQKIIGFYYSNEFEDDIPKYLNALKNPMSILVELKIIDGRLFLNAKDESGKEESTILLNFPRCLNSMSLNDFNDFESYIDSADVIVCDFRNDNISKLV